MSFCTIARSIVHRGDWGRLSDCSEAGMVARLGVQVFDEGVTIIHAEMY